MFLYDLPLDQLKTYTLPQVREPDFAAFWDRMRARSAQQPLNPHGESVSYPVSEAKVEKISFEAFDGGRIVGWLIAPAKAVSRPTLVSFHGYSGNRGRIDEYLFWTLQGFTVLTVDVRGQNGESSDFADYPSGRFTGWMTSGLLEPEKYYFTRAYLDTLRALDYACARPEVDANRVGVMGISQGGGLALAAASLDPRPKLCIAEVPGFCHIRRTLEITKAAPWTDLIEWFKQRPDDIDAAMRTLSYVELNNLTDRIQCPTLVSVGLQDDLCPPSAIFTAFNRIAINDKQADTYAFNGHQAYLNRENQIAWARKFLLSS